MLDDICWFCEKNRADDEYTYVYEARYSKVRPGFVTAIEKGTKHYYANRCARCFEIHESINQKRAEITKDYYKKYYASKKYKIKSLLIMLPYLAFFIPIVVVPILYPNIDSVMFIILFLASLFIAGIAYVVGYFIEERYATPLDLLNKNDLVHKYGILSIQDFKEFSKPNNFSFSEKQKPSLPDNSVDLI